MKPIVITEYEAFQRLQVNGKHMYFRYKLDRCPKWYIFGSNMTLEQYKKSTIIGYVKTIAQYDTLEELWMEFL